ncbi:hypothetical protein BDR22DRAFT_972437 [Usnea florida]
MYLLIAVVAATLTLLPIIRAQNNSVNASVISLEDNPSNALEATAFSLIYALPLIQLVNQTSAVYQVVNGSNRINNQAQLASLSSAAVVKPNVDTLYSRVIIDLSQRDLELTVPNITDRFWIYPFYDTFGNNFANINPVNYSQPGVYLVRRADDALAQPGIEFPDPASYSKYQGIVNSPTTYGTLLIRLLLKYNTTENLNIVHQIQNQTKLVPVPRVIQQPNTLAAPPFTGSLINDSLTGTPPEQLLQLLSRIAAYNQPARLSERYRIANILGQAGLASGTYIRPAGVNITQAYAIANATIQKYITDPNTINFVGNNWQLQKPGYAGDYGSNYAHRAYIARTGYQQTVPSITIYPGLNGPPFSNYALPANQSYLFTFSGKPPVISSLYGFWSLTFYGPDQYLIPNPLNIFSVGDRSNITYDDDSLIYGPGSNAAKDGSFRILVQQTDIVPPQNWTSNWIPAPKGGATGSFILRWYSPSDAFSNGSYVYPKVETIPAIRGT